MQTTLRFYAELTDFLGEEWSSTRPGLVQFPNAAGPVFRSCSIRNALEHRNHPGSVAFVRSSWVALP